jgi:hypothetical protein
MLNHRPKAPVKKRKNKYIELKSSILYTAPLARLAELAQIKKASPVKRKF